ncbi:MAG: hypothetical protein ABDH28_00320, partial [Brevinematia bacterium]
MRVRVSVLFILFPFLLVFGCGGRVELMEDVGHIFGRWLHERVEYSNSGVYLPPDNTSIYLFKDEFLYFTNSLSNYQGEIHYITSGMTNIVATVWALDLKNNKLYVKVGITNFTYTINMVAVDSTNVNYLWLMEGVYEVSNSI